MNEAIEQLPANYSGLVSTNALVLQGDSMDRMMSVAETMATGRVTVPKHLQNSMGDCLAIVMQSMQWGMNPFAVGQKTHLVNGVLGYEAQLVNAVVQSSGAIVGRFHYEYQGEGDLLQCRAGAVPRGESEIVWTEWLKVSQVTTKNSPLWKTNPKQQMGYLQVKNWARAYAPAAIMGVYTTDEIAVPSEKEITPEGNVATEESTTDKRPAYTAQQMAEGTPTWKEKLQGGKTTPERLIAMIESKFVLSDAQKREIHNLAAIEGEVATVADQAAIDAMLQKAEDFAISNADIAKHLGLESLESLTVEQVEQAMNYINNPG